MAAPNPVRIIPATSGNLRAGGEYVIRDEFTTACAAGAVNGTAAEPGPGTRVVVDTESKLTIAGGALTFAGGKASPENGDPGFSLSSVVRVAGRVLRMSVVPSEVNKVFSVGFDTDTLSYAREHGIYFEATGGGVLTLYTGGNSITNFATYTATETSFAFALRATGVYVFRKIGSGSWIILFVVQTQSTSPLYPAIRGNNATFTADSLRVPLARWLPTPLVSHGFGSAYGTSDGLGHAEGVAGGIGAGGSGVTFSNAGSTWSVSGGKAINTPSLGAERISNGDMETGNPPTGWGAAGGATITASADAHGGAQALKIISPVGGAGYVLQYPASFSRWMVLSAWAKAKAGDTCTFNIYETPAYSIGLQLSTASTSYIHLTGTGRFFGTGIEVQAVAVGALDEIYVDDIEFHELALSELLSLSNLACADVLAGVAITRSSTVVQVGLALNWDSPTIPANGVIVYANSLKIWVDKCVAGTWSNVSNTAYTYSAGARLVVQKNGTAYRTYYNNALVKADTISDAGILTGTYHGLFSTDATNTFDDLAIYATGTSNEYAALDAF